MLIRAGSRYLREMAFFFFFFPLSPLSCVPVEPDRPTDFQTEAETVTY